MGGECGSQPNVPINFESRFVNIMQLTREWEVVEGDAASKQFVMESTNALVPISGSHEPE